MRRIILGFWIIMIMLTVVHGADAATAKFTDLPADAIAIKLLDSLTNVWIPVIAIVALIGLVVNMFMGFVQIGGRAIGFIVGLSMLSIGLPGLKTIFGGQLVTSLILP